MPAWTEMLDDGAMGREEALGLARRLNPLQASLALARGVVGVLGASIERPVLAMFPSGKKLALGGSITL